jgi:hypothetical protein
MTRSTRFLLIGVATAMIASFAAGFALAAQPPMQPALQVLLH